MMPNTVPNQRTITIHRVKVDRDFLGIKNENWMAAARDLGAFALELYLYLAANADNYTFALSPAAVRQSIGMARSTYHDQLNRLIDKGYIKHRGGNSYDFYEVPEAAPRIEKTPCADDGFDFEKMPPPVQTYPRSEKNGSGDNIEINNIVFSDNKNKYYDSQREYPIDESQKEASNNTHVITIQRPKRNGY